MKRKKAAHNAIEKRYRTNMNAKFLALGNAIPHLRHRHNSMHPHPHHPKPLSKKALAAALKDRPAGSALPPNASPPPPAGAPPLPQNKSEVLTNALTYILELQDQNRLLQNELALLKSNLLAAPPPAPLWRPVGIQ
jgi:hypothetical protein